NSVTILLGNGDGTFAPPLANPNPITGFNGPNSIAVADFNGDGKLDLAVSNGADNLGSASVTILLGNGDGTFTVKPAFAVGTQPPLRCRIRVQTQSIPYWQTTREILRRPAEALLWWAIQVPPAPLPLLPVILTVMAIWTWPSPITTKAL